MAIEESGIDFRWYRQLCRLFEDTAMPDSIQDAISSLGDLGVDVSKLNACLEKAREDFPKAGLLQKTEFQVEARFTINHTLAIHAYTLEDPQEISIYQKVNRQFNDLIERQDTRSPGSSSGVSSGFFPPPRT